MIIANVCQQKKRGCWKGEKNEEERLIGAECIAGTVLNLTEACNGTCNYHKEDGNRNGNGVLRSHVDCQVTNLRTTQCIPELEERDGKLDCHNRADEEPFLTGIGNSSSLLLHLEHILTPCTNDDIYGEPSFKCSGYVHDQLK